MNLACLQTVVGRTAAIGHPPRKERDLHQHHSLRAITRRRSSGREWYPPPGRATLLAMAKGGTFALLLVGRVPADRDSFRCRSVSKARKEALRLARWSGGYVYIVDQRAVDRGETRPYYTEVVTPPGKRPMDCDRDALERTLNGESDGARSGSWIGWM